MNNDKKLLNLALSAMFLTLALLLPFLTGQVPQIGSMLCPMHIPIILCGYICGPSKGFVTGALAPFLRSLLFGAPLMYPSAPAMSAELAVYGFLSGMLYRVFPKKKIFIYISLLISMLSGRLVWGAVRFIITGLDPSAFGFSAFWTGAFSTAIPGIIIQLLLIPPIVIATNKNRE